MNKLTKTAVAIVLASTASLTFAAQAYEITPIGTVSSAVGDANYRLGVSNFSNETVYIDATQYGGSSLPEVALPPHKNLSVPSNFYQYHFHITSPTGSVDNTDLDAVSGQYVGVDNYPQSTSLEAQVYNM
jgi:hypothetical protein